MEIKAGSVISFHHSLKVKKESVIAIYMKGLIKALLKTVSVTDFKKYFQGRRSLGAKGTLLPPPIFWLVMFFITNDSKEKLKKC